MELLETKPLHRGKHVDFVAKRYRHAEGGSAACVGFGAVRIASDECLAALVRVGNQGRSQQRAFDLDVVNIARFRDPGLRHRFANCRCHQFNLGSGADFFRQQVARGRHTQRETRFATGSRKLRLLACEHCCMRRQHAFGAAGPDEAHALRDLRQWDTEPLRQQQLKRLRREAAREIVCASIAFSLADHGNNLARIERACIDQRSQLGRIGG